MEGHQAKMTGKVLSNHVVVITQHVRDVLDIRVGDYVALTVKKLEPTISARS